MVIGGACGIFGGPIGVIIGGAIGGLIGNNNQQDELHKVENFNRNKDYE